MMVDPGNEQTDPNAIQHHGMPVPDMPPPPMGQSLAMPVAPPVDAGQVDVSMIPMAVPAQVNQEVHQHEVHSNDHIQQTNEVTLQQPMQGEIKAPTDSGTDKDTSTMIAEAAAAAVASVAEGGASEDATAAALAVKADEGSVKDDDDDDDEARAKRNELRRKRYREKSDEGSVASMSAKSLKSHEEQLAARRLKDRERYAAMTTKQRQVYNAKRRDQYHRQSEESRQKRRERERNRYHALDDSSAKERNARRAKLERERYQRLSPAELEAKNRKRRERAAMLRKRSKSGSGASVTSEYTENTGYTSMGPSVATGMSTTTGMSTVNNQSAAAVTETSQGSAPAVENKGAVTQPQVQQQQTVTVTETKPVTDAPKEEGIKNSAAAEEAVKEAVKEAVDAVGKSEVVQI